MGEKGEKEPERVQGLSKTNLVGGEREKRDMNIWGESKVNACYCMYLIDVVTTSIGCMYLHTYYIVNGWLAAMEYKNRRARGQGMDSCDWSIIKSGCYLSESSGRGLPI